MNKLRKIIENMFIEDDKKRNLISYDLSKTIDRGIRKIKKLKLEDLKGD